MMRFPHSRTLIGAFALFFAAGVSACGSDEATPSSTPTTSPPTTTTATQSPPASVTTSPTATTTDAPTETATIAVTDTPAASETAARSYPKDVTDMLGRTVTIAAPPKRVVALSPTAAELVYAVGGTIVGRASSVKFPDAAVEASEVGTAYQPSVEAILALNPDLIVADAVIQAQPEVSGALEGTGVPVVFAGAASVADVSTGIELIGAVFDADADAAALVSHINDAIAAAKTKLQTAGVSAVAMIADRDQTLYAAKANSYAGDIMATLGITNPAQDEPDAGAFPGYTALAPEKLIEFDPDYIFTITPAPEPAPRLSTLIPQIPPFANLKAVVDQHVIELDDVLFLQAPGPRIVDAIQQIVDAVAGGSPSY